MAIAADVNIPSEAWTDVAGGSLLLTTLVVNGCALHVEAVAVDFLDDVQLWREGHEELASLRAAHGDGGPWQTVEIGGREYILVATPYCE